MHWEQWLIEKTYQDFGVEVLGLDLSENMVNIAMERAIAEKLPSVHLNFPLTSSLRLVIPFFP